MSVVTGDVIKTIFKNTGFVMLGNTLLKVMNFLFSLLVIRRLGDDRFGQYSIVISFVTLFQIFAELGMSQYVMREIARDRTKTKVLFWNLVVVRFLLGIAGTVAITSFAVAFKYSQELVIGVLVYSCSFLLAAFQSPIQIVLTANERFDLVSLMNIVGQVVFILFGSIFLFSGLGFIWLISANIINLFVQTILGVGLMHRFNLVQRPNEITPRYWPQLIKSGLPFGVITFSLSIAFNIDTVILSKYVPNAEVGWYNVAYNLIFSIMFVSGSFKEAMTPTLSKTYVDHPEEVTKWFFRMVKIITSISLPIAVGGMILAEPVIRFLYSEEYLPAARAFQLIIWDVPFLMFASFGGNISAVVKEERVGARVYLVAAVANIIMNLFIIPRYGYLGAAVTTVLTDFIAAAQFYFFYRSRLKLPNLMPIWMKIIPATLGMGLLISLFGNLHPLILLVLGASTYGILTWMLGLYDETEKRLVLRVIHKFFSFGSSKEVS
ncbi:MAG TPA: flippase [Anaerolineaceae bacterium]|nr:flippase [Anaerolineaceae bacterium]